ncbi:MAG TPA: winged helix-turn-helix domain-containing protein [Nitrososphaera sp.]|jgi:predicted transcriptional regulator
MPRSVKNQSGLDKVAIMLETANGGTTKEKLLAATNLARGRLNNYLKELLERKLISELADEDKRHVAYITTERGFKYLAVYISLKNIIVTPES